MAMNYEVPDSLVVEADGPVRVVTLNRPEHLNAFDETLKEWFPKLLMQIDRDRDARAVVLTGAGKAFCAGGSLDEFEMYRTDFELRRQAMRDARRLAEELLRVRVPLIAAINGPAVGLGCTIASLCDIVFIAESTFMADPHVTVALVAGDGGAVAWPYMTSILKVKQYLLTGDRVPATEAVNIGLANFAVPAESVLSQATQFAARLSQLPPQAVQDTKLVLNQTLLHSAARVLPLGLAAESQSHDTEAYRLICEQAGGPRTR
jgi:enoyl-CoA hydratase